MRITNRVRNYCYYRACGFSREDSALKCGYARSNARSQASKMESDPDIQRLIQEMEGNPNLEPPAEPAGVTNRKKSSGDGRGAQAKGQAVADMHKAVVRRMEDEKIEAPHRPYTMSEWEADNIKMVKSDVRSLFDENGAMKPIHEWDDDTAFAVKKVKVRAIHERNGDGEMVYVGDTQEVEFWSKDGAIDRLAKHIGAYQEDNSQRRAIGIATLSAEQQNRLGVFLRDSMGIEFDDGVIDGEFQEVAEPEFDDGS